MNASGLDQPRVSRVLVERYLDRQRLRRRWRRLAVTVTVTLLLVATAAYSVLWHTKVFDVRKETVTGLRVLTRQQVLAAAAIPAHVPVAAVDTRAVKARLLAIPRVADAWVERDLPHTIVIAVVERVPAAALPNPDGSATIVDGDGVAFDTAAAGTAVPVPVIHFDPAPGAVPGTDRASARTRSVAGALAALRALPEGLRARVRNISATGPFGITLTLTPSTRKQQQVTVSWGSGEQSDIKARILAVLIGNGAAHYDVSAPLAPAFS